MLVDHSPITEIKGIGDKGKKLYEKLGIQTVGELLRYFPKDYETFDEPVMIRQITVGEVCAVYGTVAAVPGLKKKGRLSILTCVIRDESASMQLTFFNMPFLQKVFRVGTRLVFRGLVQTRAAAFVMEQPKYYAIEDYRKLSGLLQPKYSLTKGLTNQAIQKAMRYAISQYHWEEEYLPEDIIRQRNIKSAEWSCQRIHFPENLEQAVQARERFVFEEFFLFLLSLRRDKNYANRLPNGYRMSETAETVRYIESLSFELTKGQKETWRDIRQDMEGPFCMNRLVQGDVGSGKTVIAILALLMTCANHYQGALMAPTEVLAIQHYEGIRKDAKEGKLPLRPVLLIGSMTASEKRAAREKISSGEADLIIGTHALIQESVTFHKLALVVTDEQHRFGVRQREALAGKGLFPHILVMSATPIPRTLAIILYGDLQISLIKELPADRLPIKNCVVGTAYRPKAYQFIMNQVELGHQAYVICPQVEEGEMDELENVVEYAEKLRAAMSPSVNIAYLHGKMRSAEKNQIMTDFSQKKIDVLVSTTVIEVGINVPNATVMMVENAERFGLAQLHQLRGRVGRGEAQSYCIFVSANEKKETMERLQILCQSNDGFLIAQEDLRLRGPGDLFGVRQSGDFAFQTGDIYQDSELLKLASEHVDRLLADDPKLQASEHSALRRHLEETASAGIDLRSI